MKKGMLGVCAALAMIVGCGSSSSPATKGDAGTTDSGHTTTTSGGSDSGATITPVDSGTSGGSDTGSTETGPTDNGTSGNACTTDAMCDPQGLGTSVCTSTKVLFSGGSLFPHGECLDQRNCTPSSTNIAYCDNNTGVCLATDNTGTKGICLGACSFDDSGMAPTGCTASGNVCSPYGFGSDMTGKPIGVGFCFGGCQSDADCKVAGEKCDMSDLLCKKAANIKTATAALGTTCDGSSGATYVCNCAATSAAPTMGVCVTSCIVGGTTMCPSGFTCDPTLPTTLTSSTGMSSAGFTKIPMGLEGSCVKNCTADTDCVSGQKCLQSAGLGTQKTCQFSG